MRPFQWQWTAPHSRVSPVVTNTLEKLVPTVFAVIMLDSHKLLKFTFFLLPSFYLDTTIPKSAFLLGLLFCLFFLNNFWFYLRKIRLHICNCRILVLSQIKGQNDWLGKRKVARFSSNFFHTKRTLQRISLRRN